MKTIRLTTLAAAIFIISSALPAAAQDQRTSLVQKIAVAQGLTEIYEQQLLQQREATKAYATKIYQETLTASGGEANPQNKAALEKFLTKAGDMFSGKEVANAWVKHYGKDLSVKDLQAILKYYESPVGRKDVAATKAAMPEFTLWMMQVAQERSTLLIKEFVADLQAAQK